MSDVTPMSVSQVRRLLADALVGTRSLDDVLGEIRLHPRQRDAARRLVDRIERDRGALLAEPVGSGKTFIALAVAAHFRQNVLIATPASLRSMWTDALHRSGQAATLVTHESLSRRETVGAHSGLVIVDEAHRFRTPSARRYSALAEMCRGARVLLVTATPIQNRECDLAAQLAIFLGRRAWSMSGPELAHWIVRENARATEAPNLPSQRGPIAVPLSIDDGCLDRIVALPPPVAARDEPLAVALLSYSLVHQWTSSRAALVEALRRRRTRGLALRDAVASGRMPSRAELSAWTHGGDSMQLAFPELVAPHILETGEPEALELALDRHLAGIESLLLHCRATTDPDDARAAALMRIRAEHPGERIIAFCHYAETVAGLRRRLGAVPGIAALTARGAVIASGRISRDEVIRQFTPGGDGRVENGAARIDLLITTDLLSEGVNLQEASVIVHLDLPWNPARLEQRVGRVRRLGSRHGVVTVYTIHPPAPAEQLLRIEARLRDKLRVAQRTVGVAGSILPSLAVADTPAAAEHDASIQLVLREWAELPPASPPSDYAVPIAAVRSTARGFIAAVRRGVDVSLIASREGTIGEQRDHLVNALHDARGDEVTPKRAEVQIAMDALNRYLDARRGSAAIDFAAAASARARRGALARVAQALARTPRHQRARITPLADAARAVAVAHLGEGAERVLDMLVRANLPDEAWLRSIAAFAELNSGPAVAPASGHRVIALLILEPAGALVRHDDADT